VKETSVRILAAAQLWQPW